MSKSTNENTSKTSKNLTPLPLQLILNIFNTSIHCSRERCAATTQINSTIYHSFLSCQPLGAPNNLAPTRTGNRIHDPHGIFNFSNRGITGFSIKKLQTQFELKDSKNIHCKNFELWRPLLDYLVFAGSVNLESFVLSILEKRVWVLLVWIWVQFVDDVRNSLSSAQSQINFN